MLDALQGGASNLLGQVTASSIYSHIDQSLGNWDQRPIFKTNVRSFSCIRTTDSYVNKQELYDLVALFPSDSYEYKLDPTYEPDLPEEEKKRLGVKANAENCATFKLLQKFNHVHVVKPINEEHMYYAALHSKSCQLTLLGRHYWKLVKQNRV